MRMWGRWACNNPWVIWGHLHGLFLPSFHSCYESSRSFESDSQRQTICYGFSNYMTIYTAKPTYFPHDHKPDTTFNSILRQIRSRYWPYACLSGRLLVWDIQLENSHNWVKNGLSCVLYWTRQVHTWSSKRLSELTNKLVKLWMGSTQESCKRRVWKLEESTRLAASKTTRNYFSYAFPNPPVSRAEAFSIVQGLSSENAIRKILLKRVCFGTSCQDGGVGRYVLLPRNQKKENKFKTKKQPELPENRTVWKLNNQGVKEKTFIQTGRRGRDRQLGWREHMAKWWLKDQVVPHEPADKPGWITGDQDRQHNTGFQCWEEPQNIWL